MEGLHHFCNREFCRALRDLRGYNFLLLLIDGSAVFGQIGAMSDWVVGILPPVGVPGVNQVLFRPANGVQEPLDIPLCEMLLDICDIAAMIEGRFAVPPLSAAFTPTPLPVQANVVPQFKPYPIMRQMTRQHEKLLEELVRFNGRDGGVGLFGGWVIGGLLGEVCDCMMLIGTGAVESPLLVTLGALNVFGPAIPGGMLSLCGKYRAWVNLKPLTSVLVP
ncbi:MAG: hypothetical protein P4N41_19760 [Negativicutes bacterium]|nr:hypothetical protein [Negativicutes bacterium]